MRVRAHQVAAEMVRHLNDGALARHALGLAIACDEGVGFRYMDWGGG